jgi:PAS domain S-box-containing protein
MLALVAAWSSTRINTPHRGEVPARQASLTTFLVEGYGAIAGLGMSSGGEPDAAGVGAGLDGPGEARLSESQLRQLIESLPQLVWACRAEGPCDYLSQQWIDFTGIAEREQLGYGWLQQLHPDDRERAQRQWATVVGQGLPFDIEYRIRRADGVYRWFRAHAVPLRDGRGRIVEWYGSNTDIDDYKTTELALRSSEERLRLAQQAAHIGTFEWNVQTNVRNRSPELEAMYGITPGAPEWADKNLDVFIHPDDRGRVIATVQRAFETTLPVEDEWRVVRPDGSMRWLFGRFQLFRDDASQTQRLIGVNIDITERKQAEQDIRALNESLERVVQQRTAELVAANRELEAFSYSVAHDLRVPVRAMSGFASILLEEHAKGLDEGATQCLQQIQRNATRMAELIDALLTLARVSRSELRPRVTDLSALAHEVVRELAIVDRSRHVDVVIQDDLTADVDPVLARTLFENLVGNAWKFSTQAAAPRIEVGTVDTDRGPAFFVRDNGVGFDMAFAEKLFVPFQRLHAVREFPGTGVGLATALRIVNRHEGGIWAEGRVGEGATFYFQLSRSKDNAP